MRSYYIAYLTRCKKSVLATIALYDGLLCRVKRSAEELCVCVCGGILLFIINSLNQMIHQSIQREVIGEQVPGVGDDEAPPGEEGDTGLEVHLGVSETTAV